MAGMAETALAAITRRKLIHHIEFDLHDRHHNQLRETRTGLEHEIL